MLGVRKESKNEMKQSIIDQILAYHEEGYTPHTIARFLELEGHKVSYQQVTRLLAPKVEVKKPAPKKEQKTYFEILNKQNGWSKEDLRKYQQGQEWGGV